MAMTRMRIAGTLRHTFANAATGRLCCSTDAANYPSYCCNECRKVAEAELATRKGPKTMTRANAATKGAWSSTPINAYDKAIAAARPQVATEPVLDPARGLQSYARALHLRRAARKAVA